jgi:hypothetical protein
MTSNPTERQSPGFPLRRAWLGLMVFYAVALALNAVSLHRNNEHMPYGPVRSFWVAVSEPIAKVAAAQGWNRPRDALARTAGAALNGE